MIARGLRKRFRQWLLGSAWSEAWDQTTLEMWGGHWNTDDLFKADADQERLREFAALWESNPRDAFPEFVALAEAGSVWSMVRIGCGYRDGLGVRRDKRCAERWFDAAFDRGSDYGLIWSARMARSRGDFAKAKATLSVGVERCLLPAMVALAGLEIKTAKSSEDRERARSLLESAIANGFLPAKRAYACAMAHGAFGWRNIPEGFRRSRALVKVESDAVGERQKEILAAKRHTADARHVA